MPNDEPRYGGTGEIDGPDIARVDPHLAAESQREAAKRLNLNGRGKPRRRSKRSPLTDEELRAGK